MTTVTRTGIVLALTFITATGALAAPRKAVPAPASAAVLGGGPVIGLPFTATPEEEARFDPAKGYPSGY